MTRSRSTVFLNDRNRDWRTATKSSEIRKFHENLPGYQQTRLVELQTIFPVDRVFLKEENSRFELPAFKGLGASWAIKKAIENRSVSDPKIIATASDGNHGRAVAHFAKKFGYESIIFIPEGVSEVAINAIKSEGADVRILAASYDNAVATAANQSHLNNWLLVQDTSWPGYEEIPQNIVDGYSTLFFEIDEQLANFGIQAPDYVFVPTGVGSLLQAALEFYRSKDSDIKVFSVEAESAACMAISLKAGKPIQVETKVTVMAGLNCGTPSTLAWPAIANGLDGVIEIVDADVVQAVDELSKRGIDAGPCGASTWVAASTLFNAASDFSVKRDAVAVLISTEGLAANPLPAKE